jgi:hypothetical protein
MVDQLTNLQTVSAAALDKETTHAEKVLEVRENRIDPNDAVVDALIVELGSLADVLDENNKDMEWFVREIDARVRGKRRDEGPSFSHSPNQRQQQQQPQAWQQQQQAFVASSPNYQLHAGASQQSFQSGQFSAAAHESAVRMQEQAALQMQMQTALMTKLIEALEEPPRRSRGHSRRHHHSRSRSRGDSRGRSSSAHSRRSFHRPEMISSGDEEPARQPTPKFVLQRSHVDSAHSSEATKSKTVERGRRPVDGQVWVDEDNESGASSPQPTIMAANAASSIRRGDDAAVNTQDTPRLATAGRLQRR